MKPLAGIFGLGVCGLLASLLCACGYPATTVSTVQSSPMLRVTGAPAGATILVDNLPAGAASLYGQGGHALLVPHGTHRIAIVSGSLTMYDATIYFGDDTIKTITLPPVVQ